MIVRDLLGCCSASKVALGDYNTNVATYQEAVFSIKMLLTISTMLQSEK